MTNVLRRQFFIFNFSFSSVLVLNGAQLVGDVIDHVGHVLARELDTLFAEHFVYAVSNTLTFAHQTTTRLFTLFRSQQETASSTQGSTADKSGKEIQTFHNSTFLRFIIMVFVRFVTAKVHKILQSNNFSSVKMQKKHFFSRL